MHSLPLFFRLQGRAVILVGTGDGANAKRVLLERAGATVVGESAQAALAIVAVDNEPEALSAVARLKARGILVNAVDRPALCDFTLPAIIDRHPVVVAIGTGGASAGLAKALRQRLEAILPQSLGIVATALANAREAIRARWPEAASRRRAIDAALDPGGPLDVLSDYHANALETWLSAPVNAAASGLRKLQITSDDPDQLTLEYARLLGQADTIYYAPSIAPAILARARADAVRIAGDPPRTRPDGLTLYLVPKEQA